MEDLNRSYSDCGVEEKQDIENENYNNPYQRKFIDQDESILNNDTMIVSDTESIDEPLHLFSKPSGIMARRPR